MELKKAIKKTIAYAEKFNCSLSVEEIKERFISDKVYNDEELDKVIETLRSDFVRTTSLNRETYAKEKVQKAKQLAKLIENNFKDVLFLGITGSVAAGYPKKNDDIDLLIVTKKNKLWLTRLKLRIFINLNKIPHRKFGEKEKSNEFCFNLWLDTSSLRLNKEKQNLKNAIDLILLKSLINKENTYQKFIKENYWAKKYVATGYSKIDIRSSIVDRRKTNNNFIFDKVINWLIFWPQYWYMKKRIKNEKIGLHEAFFHH